MLVQRVAAVFAACALLLSSCSLKSAGSTDEFTAWLAADASRATAFARFEAALEAAGVSGVVPNHQLWLVDRLRPRCVTQPFAAPPRELWSDIVPALRFIRDHVKPAIGDVIVVSSYRDQAFNACVRGAPLSAHRLYRALDLLPADRSIGRDDLIAQLCAVHAQQGPSRRVGLGIYNARRFHIDANGFRGWGDDHHAATFPCARSPES